MKTTPLGPFLGINNRKLSDALHVDKTGDYLAAADNVDVDDVGHLRRRVGLQLVQAMANAHSLYMHTTGNGYLVRGACLYAITLPSYTETLLKVLTSDARMSYQHYGLSDHFFSNGTDSGRVTGGVVYPMGMPTLDSPALAVIGGSLLKGWYQVGLSYTNSTTGEESSVGPSSNVELTATGGLRVTLPGTSPGATHVNIYLSASNGTVPCLHSTVTVATATHDLTTLATGRPSNGLFEAPLPAGQLFSHNGRLCSYSGNTLYVGSPYRPGYYQPAGGYIPFPDTISVAVSNTSGVFVAAKKTHYIPGDLNDVKDQIVDVLPYGAVPGTAFVAPNKPQWGWFSARGIVLVDTSPEPKVVMADVVDLTAPTVGVSAVLEQGGFRRVASCGWTQNLTNGAATTYSGWDFTSFSYIYGTKADGIYTVGTGTAEAVVNLGKQSFGSEQLKHVPAVYLGASGSLLNLRIKTPAADYTYPARATAADLKQQRVDPGKGLRSNWFELILSNTAGADFKLATVSFAPAATSRRI